MPALLLVVNLVAAAFMTGLIWFVQVVHYPLFAAVGRDASAAYAAGHQRLTTLVVGPVMLVEAATAALLVALPPTGAPRWALWTGLGLVALIWLSTALVQVPQHGRLAAGFDGDAHALLVGSNWVRTAAWTARTVLLVWLLLASPPTVSA